MLLQNGAYKYGYSKCLYVFFFVFVLFFFFWRTYSLNMKEMLENLVYIQETKATGFYTHKNALN